MKGNVYTVCFAAILGTVCALLLTGVAAFTEETRERNKRAEKNRNIFTALNIEFDDKANAEILDGIFAENIREKPSIEKLEELFKKTAKKYKAEEFPDAFQLVIKGVVNEEGIMQVFNKTTSTGGDEEAFAGSLNSLDDKYPDLTLYRSVDGQGEVTGVAVDFEGNGLWAKIKGILALKNDMRTIKGITFYEQEETPGLGGDIVTEGFRSGFVGKRIVDADGKPGIVIKAGLVDAADNEIDGISGATMTVDKVAVMLNKVIVDIAK